MTSMTTGSTASPHIAQALTRFSIHIGITVKVKIGIKSERRPGGNTGFFFFDIYHSRREPAILWDRKVTTLYFGEKL